VHIFPPNIQISKSHISDSKTSRRGSIASAAIQNKISQFYQYYLFGKNGLKSMLNPYRFETNGFDNEA
jgi:hypothetical protein